MRKTALLITVALVMLCLASCTGEDFETSEAVKSMIAMRIDAHDYDGAMEVLDNCQEDLISEDDYGTLRQSIITGANEYLSASVDEIIKTEGYEKAYAYLEDENNIPSVIPTKDIAGEKDRVRRHMIDNIILYAQSCAKEHEYAQAIQALNGIQSDSYADKRAEQLIEEYKVAFAKYAIEMDDTDALNGDELTTLLSEAYIYTENDEIFMRIREYRRPEDIARLNAIKGRIVVDYDKENNVHIVRTKRFNEFVIRSAKKKSGILSSGITECGGEITFMLVLAYSTDELLETDEILFNCDGISYSFAIADGHREEKVIDIDNDLEICGIFDSTTAERFALSKFMTALEGADRVVVTARGLTRDMDFEISNDEIDELMVLWHAYLVLRENPSLFAEVYAAAK